MRTQGLDDIILAAMARAKRMIIRELLKAGLDLSHQFITKIEVG